MEAARVEVMVTQLQLVIKVTLPVGGEVGDNGDVGGEETPAAGEDTILVGKTGVDGGRAGVGVKTVGGAGVTSTVVSMVVCTVVGLTTGVISVSGAGLGFSSMVVEGFAVAQ